MIVKNMSKDEFYKSLHSRMESAIANEYYLEASWYCYAMLEDRLVSLLKHSGGVGLRGSYKPIKTLGRKLGELHRRAENDDILHAYLKYGEIDKWKDDRNRLMHAMADGSVTVEENDKQAFLLATKGRTLLKQVSADARKLKKRRT